MTVRPYRLWGRGRRDSVREGKRVRDMRLAFVLTWNGQLTTKAVFPVNFLAFHIWQKEGMLKALCVGIHKWDGEKARHHVTSIGQNNNPKGQQLMAVCFRKVCTFMSQQKSWRKVLGWLSSTSIIGIFSSTVTRSFSSSVNNREARYTPLTEKMRD